MESAEIRALRGGEKIILRLRMLYEQYGYRKYRMGKFEEYELYTENKSFLKNPNIITFHDLDGRVLAMKPDVTLSIAKNSRATARSSEKLYYLENIYWLEKQSGGYREMSQLGLEYIGRLDALAAYETLYLAQRTLAAITDRHMMQVSHIGFWVSLMDGLGVGENTRRDILNCLHGKRLHELKTILDQANVPPAAADLILRAGGLCGPFPETLASARAVAISQGMTRALDELEKTYQLLEANGCADGMTLDFSLVNESDYYDGLIFQGFAEGVPRALLSGGYYGRLLRKFGRDLDAIGFAVYLNELDFLFRSQGGADVDALILYDGDADPASVIRSADALRAQGLNVRTEKSVPEDIRFGAVYRLTPDGLREVSDNA